MSYTEDTFTTDDGLTLFTRTWRPAASSRAAIALVHGAWEHSGRYAHVAERLVDAGYAVYTFDHRGHGKSEGPRVYVRSADRYLGDLERFLVHVHTKAPDVPLFLLGHSMGGGLVTLFAIERTPAVAGLILSGPLLALHTPTVLQHLVTGVARVAPWLPVFKVDPGAVSRDPTVVARYENDPLTHTGWVRAAMMAVIVRIPMRIQPRMEHLTQPLLILHGTADQLTDFEGSRQLRARAGTRDKTLTLYEGLYHEVLNEPERDQVLADVVAWLGERA